MRMKHVTLIILILSVLLIACWRQHLRDLLECAQTHLHFDNFLTQHPTLLFQYPPAAHHGEPLPPTALDKPVPKIIHQIYLAKGIVNAATDNSLDAFKAARESCQLLHPTWQTYLWTDANASTFLQDYYPSLLPSYFSYAHTPQRVNLLQYAVLHHYGGVYLDLDISCHSAFDDPLPAASSPVPSLAHLPWLSTLARSSSSAAGGITGTVLLARPQHPLLELLLARIPSRHLQWGLPDLETQLSTGDIFLSNTWLTYASRLYRSTAPLPPGESIYLLVDEHHDSGSTAPHTHTGELASLFTHPGPKHSPSWDAMATLLLGRHYRLFMCVVFLVLCARTLITARSRLRDRRRRSRLRK